MYTIKVDGQVLYAPALSEEYSMVLSPKLELEVNRAGSLSFTLLHGHPIRGSIHKMKSVITVERDGEEVFRGRATEEKTDLYGQTEYYCEGELSFLLDSMQRPEVYDCTAEEFLKKLISNHNAQVEAFKRFTVGRVTAVDESNRLEQENVSYHDTSGEIGNELLSRYGGYLLVRNVNGTRYLDYLASLEEFSEQKIEFGVNLLDLENSLEAKDIFTVLIPLGDVVNQREPLTIADVNGGSDYIENAVGIARYGRITKTHTWDDIDDPEKLLEAGLEKLNECKVADTLTLTAVDLQLAGVDTDKLWVGYKIRFYSEPHGISRYEACMKMSVDMENPENNQYVFGTIPATLADGMNEHTRALQDLDSKIKETQYGISINKQYIDEAKKSIASVLFEMDAIKASILLKADKAEVDGLSARLSSAEIKIDGALAAIELKANRSELSDLGDRISMAEIKIDGANATIDLNAKRIDETIEGLDERITTAEINIDGANAAISLKASKTDVDGLEERVSTAEILIDGMNSEISLKADKIDLQGYVTADELETDVLEVVNASYIETIAAGFIGCGDVSAEQVNCTGVATDVVETDTLWVTGAHVESLALGGSAVSSGKQTVVTSMNGLEKTYTEIWYMDADGVEQYARVLTNVELRYPNTVTLNYLSV